MTRCWRRQVFFARIGTTSSVRFRPWVAKNWRAAGRRAEQRIRENGVTYNVYGDPLGMNRPWNLDAIPLLIPPAEWRVTGSRADPARAACSTGFWRISTVRRNCCASGHLPPALVFANPVSGGLPRVPVPDNTYLHLLAVDLARSPDGQWWVLADRTQAPSGAGYALENRIVLAETFPGSFPRIPRAAAGFVFPRLPRECCCGCRHRAAAIRGSCC